MENAVLGVESKSVRRDVGIEGHGRAAPDLEVRVCARRAEIERECTKKMLEIGPVPDDVRCVLRE